MKDVKLVERKQSERLIKLVDAIPELTIRENGRVEIEKGIMYQVKTGDICWTINGDRIIRNPLKNAHKLKEALNSGIKNVTEESFCDLLEQHLYLVAKEKMEELLPQIQEHYPMSEIMENGEELEIVIMFETEYDISGDNSVYYNKTNYKIEVDNLHDEIWEDKENLIVKKPKPWWETQGYYYKIYINDAVVPAKMSSCQSEIYSHNIKKVGKNDGVKTFKSKQEAQAMCDKLNAVLKGE